MRAATGERLRCGIAAGMSGCVSTLRVSDDVHQSQRVWWRTAPVSWDCAADRGENVRVAPVNTFVEEQVSLFLLEEMFEKDCVRLEKGRQRSIASKPIAASDEPKEIIKKERNMKGKSGAAGV